MALWNRLFPRRAKASITHTAFSLFTADGSRGIDVRIREGLAYYVEREQVQGTIWKDRDGRPEGPYENTDAAEAAAIISPWFSGENSN